MVLQNETVDGSGAMFDRIAGRYDLVNRVLSLGLDRRWRRALVAALDCAGPAHVLDVATGTGDVALAVCRTHAEAQVTGLDPSGEMLLVARKKAAAVGLDRRVTWVQGDAQAMPFADDTFAASCISFGIRNVPDRLQGLREMARVTRPGGAVAVLELGEPKDGVLGPLARFHVHHVVPAVGGWLSRAPEYRYLQRSIAAFPSPARFVAMMTEAGLVDVVAHRLSFGAVTLYVGRAA